MDKYDKNKALYDQLVAANSNFERKGKTMPYTSANGYMFSLLNKNGQLGIRLPKETQAEFKEKYDSDIFLSYGATMKDYVLVPDDMLENDQKTLGKYLQQSFEFVMSLKPK